MQYLSQRICFFFIITVCSCAMKTKSFHHHTRTNGKAHSHRQRHWRSKHHGTVLEGLREDTLFPIASKAGWLPTLYHHRFRHTSTGGGGEFLQSHHAKFGFDHQRASSATQTAATKGPEDLEVEKAKMLKRLLEDYESDEPPNSGPGTRVDTAIAFVANKLMHLDAVEQTMTVVGTIRQFWYDPRFSFDGAMNVSKAWDSQRDFLVVSPDDIWRPDTTVLNSVDFNWDEMCDNAVSAFVYEDRGSNYKRVRVNGSELAHGAEPEMKFNMMWSRPCVLKTKCNINIEWYPFDTNVCPLIFGPWGQSFVAMYVATQGLDSKVSLPEFAVHILNAASDVIPHDNITKVAWPSVTVNLQLERHAHYYVVNIICPMIMLVMLTWFALWIPLGSIDRVAAMLTLVLTAIATQSINAEKRPATDNDMWLDDFQTAALILVILAAMYTVFSSRYAPDESWDVGRKKDRTENLKLADRVAVGVFPTAALLIFGYLFWELLRYEEMAGYAQKNFSGAATIAVAAFCVASSLLMCIGIMSHWCTVVREQTDKLQGRLAENAKALDRRVSSSSLHCDEDST